MFSEITGLLVSGSDTGVLFLVDKELVCAKVVGEMSHSVFVG